MGILPYDVALCLLGLILLDERVLKFKLGEPQTWLTSSDSARTAALVVLKHEVTYAALEWLQLSQVLGHMLGFFR